MKKFLFWAGIIGSVGTQFARLYKAYQFEKGRDLREKRRDRAETERTQIMCSLSNIEVSLEKIARAFETDEEKNGVPGNETSPDKPT